MGVDSAGYNTANAFSAGNALGAGLQQAAVYDPTQQSTGLQTSVAGTLNSQNNSTQDTPGSDNMTSMPTAGTLSTASNNTAFPNWSNILGQQNKLTVSQGRPLQSITPTGQTSTTTSINPNFSPLGEGRGGADGIPDPYVFNNTPDYMPTVVTQTPVSQVTNTNVGGAAGINANNAARQNGLTDITAAGGYKTISVRTSDGMFAYYTFDPTSGAYKFAGSYDKNGVQTQGQSYTDAQGRTQYANSLSASDRQGAVLQSLGAGQTFGSGEAANQASIVTQLNNPSIIKWQAANSAAAANGAQTELTQQTAAALAYMQANGGALPPMYRPGMSGKPDYSQDALAAAQQQYQQYLGTRASEDANAALLGVYANKPIDTAAVDATSQAANEAYASIGASQGGTDAGGGSRLGAPTGAAIVGQGALNHQNAAASSYYTNMQAFGQALQAQAQTDAGATSTKLNSDVQNVQDVATALESHLDQLDTQTQQVVKQQLANLQRQIEQYQYAMQNYKDNTKLIHDLAIGVLALGGAIATAATGGLAGIGIAAATAAATAGAKAA